jgi:hypothetical protein
MVPTKRYVLSIHIIFRSFLYKRQMDIPPQVSSEVMWSSSLSTVPRRLSDYRLTTCLKAEVVSLIESIYEHHHGGSLFII